MAFFQLSRAGFHCREIFAVLVLNLTCVSGLAAEQPARTAADAVSNAETGFVSHSSQEPPIAWSVTVNSSGDDIGSGTAVDSKGNVYFAFHHQTNAVLGTHELPGQAFVISKLDSSGNHLWSQQFTNSSDYMWTLANLTVDQNDDLMVGMYSHVFGTPEKDGVIFEGTNRHGIFFAKISKVGTVLWVHGGTGEWLHRGDEPSGPSTPFGTVDAEGNYVSAFAAQGAQGHSEVSVVKISPQEQKLWSHQTVGNGADFPTAIAVDSEMNIYVAGVFAQRISFGDIALGQVSANGTPQGFIAKYRKDGQMLWVRQLFWDQSGRNESIGGITALPNAELWFAGYIRTPMTMGSYSLSEWSTFLAQIDSNGEFRALNKIDALFYPRSLFLDRDGHFVIGGARYPGIQTNPLFVAKVTTEGMLLWGKELAAPFEIWYGQSAMSPNGDIYITVGMPFSASHRDAVLTKVASNPVVLPRIVVQPVSQTNQVGTSVTFSVEASRAERFQWFFNGAAIFGATSSAAHNSQCRCRKRRDVLGGGLQFSRIGRSKTVTLVVFIGIQLTTIAGTGIAGNLDSEIATNAQLNAPDGPSIAPDGTIYFADTANNNIRFLSPSGALGTLAGGSRVGYFNAMGTNALFSFPLGVLALRNGAILVPDTENDVIRRIDPSTAVVETFSGSGARGYANGASAFARYAFPNDLVETAGGAIYVTEFQNHTVRRIFPDGSVFPLAGNGVAGYRDGTAQTLPLMSPPVSRRTRTGISTLPNGPATASAKSLQPASSPRSRAPARQAT